MPRGQAREADDGSSTPQSYSLGMHRTHVLGAKPNGNSANPDQPSGAQGSTSLARAVFLRRRFGLPGRASTSED